jgi:hypothetical protein
VQGRHGDGCGVEFGDGLVWWVMTVDKERGKLLYLQPNSPDLRRGDVSAKLWAANQLRSSRKQTASWSSLDSGLCAAILCRMHYKGCAPLLWRASLQSAVIRHVTYCCGDLETPKLSTTLSRCNFQLLRVNVSARIPLTCIQSTGVARGHVHHPVFALE